ncbi:hypothetical protein BVX93_00970 [bacterium B13(2017)]|nr:hypothetical protein BVX93_00970 [bacterium B13(2017)]
MSTAILLTFLIGIGIGYYIAHFFWKYLWLVEGLIGVYGILVISFYNYIDKIMFISLAMCILLLLLPSLLIGISFPLFVGYAKELNKSFLFNRTYSLYNWGAVFTIIIIEFVLIRLMGIKKSIFIISSGNIFISVILFTLYTNIQKFYLEKNYPESIKYKLNEIISLIFISIASALFQLLMIKILECVFGPFRENFALIVSSALLGIALGSAIINLFKINFYRLLILNLFGLLIFIGGFKYFINLYVLFYTKISEQYFLLIIYKLIWINILMGIPFITFGSTIPALIKTNDNLAKSSGRLLFIVSIANGIGFLLLGIFHVNFDYGMILIIILCLSGLSLYVYIYKSFYKILLVSILIILGFTFYKTNWKENLLYYGYRNFQSIKKYNETNIWVSKVDKIKDLKDLFCLVWKNNKPYFFINGYISIPLGTYSETLVGAISTIFSPRLDKALVLGTGSGATASIVGQVFNKTDSVEISKVVSKNLSKMKDYNFDIINNPKVKLINNDAISYLKQSNIKYSLILSTVTTPIYFTSSKLYSKDFFDIVKDHLTHDGIYVTWLDSRIGEKGLNIILKSLSASFKKCGIAYINTNYFLLLSSNYKIQINHPYKISDNLILKNHFLKNHGINTDWLIYHLLHENVLSYVDDKNIPINTIDYPILEYEMARDKKQNISKFIHWLIKEFSIENLQNALPEDFDLDELAMLREMENILYFNLIPKSIKKYFEKNNNKFSILYKQFSKNFAENYYYHLKDPKDYYNYGEKYFRLGKIESALKGYKECYKLSSKYYNINLSIAKCYEILRKYDLAIKYFHEEIKNNSKAYKAYFGIAKVYCKKNQYNKALNNIEKALLIYEDEQYLYLQGQIFESLKMKEHARLAYKKTLDNNKYFFKAKNKLKKLQK